ncbi:hypothetical protein RBA41_23730 [Massilia sp. CCM 9210]|uniref:hypothetical protein n=1 Tax=Massilia scottii TaxID=3057166 RepID=UPI002796D0D8|nr:hypothetical protein [Massilia sp. CCM 9210]MDQ1816311.1 hypothetical protein [Massilia sp. CCM 9210]
MNKENMLCRRGDSSLARVIEVAIAYQEALGYPSAKVYLMEQGVPKEIIQRVLTTNGRRRAAAALHTAS